MKRVAGRMEHEGLGGFGLWLSFVWRIDVSAVMISNVMMGM